MSNFLSTITNNLLLFASFHCRNTRMCIEQYVHDLLRRCQPVGLAANAPGVIAEVFALGNGEIEKKINRPTDQSTDQPTNRPTNQPTNHFLQRLDANETAQVEELKESLDVLFQFSRMPTDDGGFALEVAAWTEQVAAVLVRVSPVVDHQYLLHHLIR
jgi:hypothetical protein